MNKVLKRFDVLKFKNNCNLKDIIEELVTYVETLEKQRDKAYKELREYSKDEDIVKLKQEINRLYDSSVSILTPKEKENVKLFISEHSDKCGCDVVDFIVSPTGIGDVVRVKCKGCNEEKDITDYECW